MCALSIGSKITARVVKTVWVSQTFHAALTFVLHVVYYFIFYFVNVYVYACSQMFNWGRNITFANVWCGRNIKLPAQLGGRFSVSKQFVSSSLRNRVGEFIFFVERYTKPFCLICQVSFAHFKASNLQRHFSSLHAKSKSHKATCIVREKRYFKLLYFCLWTWLNWEFVCEAVHTMFIVENDWPVVLVP